MSDAVAITMLPEATRFIVRGEPAAFGGYGLSLPRESCRASTNGTLSALWLGPDEWLVLVPDGRPMTIPMGSVVEVSDRQVAI